MEDQVAADDLGIADVLGRATEQHVVGPGFSQVGHSPVTKPLTGSGKIAMLRHPSMPPWVRCGRGANQANNVTGGRMRRSVGWRQATVAGLAAACALGGAVAAAQPSAHKAGAQDSSTSTPIKHVVVIFQENVSFDHYFGTYPNAANTSGELIFGPHHVSVNGLYDTPGQGGQGNLLTNNPNKDAGGNQVNPRRLDPSNINDVLLCDQDHDYNDEQKAFDGGNMDKFITTVGTASGKSGTGQPCNANDVMN